MKSNSFLASLLVVLMCACGTETQKTNSTEVATVTPAGTALPLDHPVVTEPVSRIRSRRLSVAQWRASFPHLLGNDVNDVPIVWRTLADTTVSSALGEPDFLATTEEALEPNVVYAKYNDDAARDGCTRAMAADKERLAAGKPVQEMRILRFVTPATSSDDAAVRANLVYLKKHFHGIEAGPGDATRIEPLRTLFNATVASSTAATPEAKAEAGWKMVCVALMTSPEFNAY